MSSSSVIPGAEFWATEYTLRHQQQIAGLVLISTGLKTTQWKDDYYAERKRLNLEGAQPEEIFLTKAEREIGKPMLDKTWDEFSTETFDSLLSTYINDYDLTVRLKEITVPVLNIFGDKDVRFPLQVTTSFRNFNGRIEDFKIEGAGHFPFLIKSNREEILEIIATRFSKP